MLKSPAGTPSGVTPGTMLQTLKRAASIARAATSFLVVVLFLCTHLRLPFDMPNPFSLSHNDKIFHTIAYMTLALSSLISWELTSGWLQPQHFFLMWLVGIAYGAFDEITQLPVGRTPDGMDWLCDIVGLVVGLAIFRVARPLVYRLLFAQNN